MPSITTGRGNRSGQDRPRPPIAVPPAYPDQETWRRFGLFRRQLRRSERLAALTPTPAAKPR